MAGTDTKNQLSTPEGVKSPLDFQSLFESSPEPYLVLTPALTIVAVNNAYLTATMTQRNEIVGRQLFEVFPDNPSDPAGTGVSNLRASLKRVLQHQRPDTMAVQKYDVRRPESAGGGFEERYWSPVNSPVFGPQGEVAYIIHHVEDVTEFIRLKHAEHEQYRLTEELRSRAAEMEAEIYRRAQQIQEVNSELRKELAARKEAEEALRRSHGDLERRVQARTTELLQRNRDLETLLYVTSNDLREPLRAIESFSRLIQERYADRFDDKGKDFLSRVMRGAQRMERLMADLLELSRAQRMELPSEDMSGASLVMEALGQLEERIKETGARIRVAQDLPSVRVNRTWATQGLRNLIANALKFTIDGAVPDIEIAPYEPDADHREAVGVVVRDRGPGVLPEHQERIFKLFQRAVGREVDGTGAGLAIVRQVAERHGGRSWVQPRVGGGSEFFLTFRAPDSREGKKT